MAQGRDHQNRKENEKQGIDDFSDPDRDLGRAKGEKQNQRKEHKRENQKRRRLRRPAQQRLNARRKGCGGASGNGKERPDGQIQDAGKRISIALADLAGQGLQAVGMRIADGRDAQNRNADRRDDESDHGRNRIAAGKLTQMDRENQVSRAKEHAEQRCRHQYPLPDAQSFLHGVSLLCFFPLILPWRLQSEKRLFIIRV